MSIDLPADLITGTIGKVVDAISSYFPSEEDKKKLQIAVQQATDAGDLAKVQQQLSVIISDSQSADKWTSRARPSFMYVIYILILWSLPFSIFYIISPDNAKLAIDGFHAWLNAIPDSMYELFGVGYLGYTGARTVEKHSDNGVRKAQLTGVNR